MHIGQCHLCLRRGRLIRSHVLPEFMYRAVYEPESHTYLTVSSEPGQRGPRREQKGLREYLLCGDCEQHLSRLENYAAPLLRRAAHGAEALTAAGFLKPVVTIEPFDYPKFKLFGMSLLWRMGEASNFMFRGVRLGPHAERLRSMLLADDPGATHEFPFALVRFAGVDFAPTLITAPGATRFGLAGVNAYMLKAMGFDWVFLVSTQAGETGQHPYFVGYSLPSMLIPVHYRQRGEFIEELRSHIPALRRA